MPLLLVEDFVIMFNLDCPENNAYQKLSNGKPRLVFIFPDLMPENVVFPIRFMEWKLSSAAELNFFSKNPLPGSSGSNTVPKSMFESFLGEGQIVGAMGEDVD